MYGVLVLPYSNFVQVLGMEQPTVDSLRLLSDCLILDTPLWQVYLERVSELEKITADRDEQRKYHDDCKKQRFNDFMDGWVDRET